MAVEHNGGFGSNFDSLAKRRPAPAEPKMAMDDMSRNTYRNVSLLGSAKPSRISGLRVQTGLDVLTEACASRERGDDDEDRKALLGRDAMDVDELEGDSPSLPRGAMMQPDGESDLILPALRMSEPRSRSSSLADNHHETNDARSSPALYPSLPSIASLLNPDQRQPHEEVLSDDLHKMRLHSSSGRADERLKHVLMIQQILVSVNSAWKLKQQEMEEEDEAMRTPIAMKREMDCEEEDIKPIIVD